ncbi:MAG: response regulator [Pirellulaceae bacterium]|nr:response regulator [Pirellulaceae bacterium]
MDSKLSPVADRPLVAVVDDEPHMRLFEATALKPLEVEVAGFGTVAEFIAALDQQCFDCAVIDLRLPDGTGMDAAAAVRNRNHPTSLVLVSGYANVRVAVQALRGGMLDVLEKPFAAYELRDAVRRGIEICRLRRQQNDQQRDVQSRLQLLTTSERDVLELVMLGLPNKVIAKKLNLGLRTVESRKQALYKKLSAESVSELVQFAMTAGIGLHDSTEDDPAAQAPSQSASGYVPLANRSIDPLPAERSPVQG